MVDVPTRLQVLHAELDEYNATLSELRRRIKLLPDEPADIAFHQNVLINIQHAAWEVEREILTLTPKQNKHRKYCGVHTRHRDNK